MDKFININSRVWFDLVFEERIKRYGAFGLRQNSSKRYTFAFLTIVLFTAINSVLPRLHGVMKNFTKKELTLRVDVVDFLFFFPFFVKDEEISGKRNLKTLQKMQESTFQISAADVTGKDEEHWIYIKYLTKPGVGVDNLVETRKPLEFVEPAPSFPGGTDILKKILSENIKYPVIAIENGIEGRVFIKYVFSFTGDIMDSRIFQGVDSSLDREALRMVGLMPRWIPCIQKGKAVSVHFTLPVEFRLHS